MKKGQFFLLFLFLISQQAAAQPTPETLANLSKAKSESALKSIVLDTLSDTVIHAFLDRFDQLTKDKQSPYETWWIGYQRYLYSQGTALTPDTIRSKLMQLEALAEQSRLSIEAGLMRFYRYFDAYHDKSGSFAEVYNGISHEVTRMEAIGWENYKPYRLARLLRYIGRFYHESGENDLALTYLKKAETYLPQYPYQHRNIISTYNLIQTIYQEQGNLEAAVPYAQKILEHVNDMSPNSRDYHILRDEWQSIATLDLANLYLSLGKQAESEVLADAAYQRIKAKVDNNPRDTSQLLTEFDVLQTLIAVKIAVNQLDAAKLLMERSETIRHIILSVPNLNPLKFAKYFNNTANYYEKVGQPNKAIQYYKEETALRNNQHARLFAAKLEQIKRLTDAHKHEIALQNDLDNHRWQRLALLASVIVLGLLILMVWLNYRRALSDKAVAHMESQMAARELEGITRRLREKSELSEQLRSELEHTKRRTDTIHHLEQLLNSTIITDEDWNHFRLNFEKVHPGYLALHQEKVPDLTRAELRYLALEKLGLSTQEMARMTGVSDVAIRQTRRRLKSKTSEKPNETPEN